MIAMLIRLSWTNLMRDRTALILTYVLPIVFFSIFASVFAQQERALTRRLECGIVDEDNTDTSRRVFAALRDDRSLDARLTHPRENGVPITRAIADQMIREGRMPAAIIIPKGFEENFGSFVGNAARIDLLADKSDPVAPQMLNGLLQKTAMTAAPDRMIEQGLSMFRKFAGELTPAQQAAMDLFLPQLRKLAIGDGEPESSSKPATTNSIAKRDNGPQLISGPVSVNVIDVLNSDHNTSSSPALAFYAAGTAVMFLLFSASGAGGALLEEEENGTIERLLAGQLNMTQVLLGKWVFLGILGFSQVSVMFLWGWAVFGMNLFTVKHFTGFIVMSTFTAAAAGAFGLLLATLSRSRAQLSGISTTLILVMSAVGGSMFPRFMMPETMKTAGYFTFNAWALDGYHKVFWYDLPLPELWPQLLALLLMTVAFLSLARWAARRWETV